MSTDDSSSVPISGWISTGEFLEQVGTDHPAPRERAGGARTHHWGELLGEAINACKLPWDSSILTGLAPQGQRMLKAVFQPSRWSQLCGIAFTLAQHSSSSCIIGKVPQNPVIPLNMLLEKIHLGTKTSQDTLILFQAAHPGKCYHSQGSPDQSAPLSRASHPSSTVTAALGPVHGNRLPSALTLEWSQKSHRKLQE